MIRGPGLGHTPQLSGQPPPLHSVRLNFRSVLIRYHGMSKLMQQDVYSPRDQHTLCKHLVRSSPVHEDVAISGRVDQYGHGFAVLGKDTRLIHPKRIPAELGLDLPATFKGYLERCPQPLSLPD